MTEDFVPVKGFEQEYKISPRGEVYSIKYKRILKPQLAVGYPRVGLYKLNTGKPIYRTIHRLLALHFISNPEKLPEVNHKDGNRQNFSLDNLEWCTRSENMQHTYDSLGNSAWNKGKALVDRRKNCEWCKDEFLYKKPQNRFCSNSCSSKWKSVNTNANKRTRSADGSFTALALKEGGLL